MAETKRTGGGHGRNHGYQRPKDMKGTFKKLMGYVGKYKGSLVLVAVCLLISSAASVATSYLLKPLLNDYIIPGDFPGLFKMLLVMGGMYLLSSLCSFAYARIMVHVAQHTVAALRQDLFNRLQQLPVSYYDRHQSGDLMSRFTNDIDTVSEMLNSSFASIISNVLTFVGTVVMMIVLNPWLTLITFLFLGLMGLVVKVIGGRSRANFQRQQAALGALNGYIEEMIEGQKVVQAFGHEAESLAAFDEVNGQLQEVSLKAIFFSSLTNPATRFVNNIVYAGVGLVGALYAVGGGISIGQLSIFLSYANQYTKPFNEISGVVTELQNALACAARVFELLDAEDQCPEAEDAARLEPDGHVQIEDVSFRYLPDRPLIEGLSLDVRPGQRIAIVGPTGCGKTTLINLLMKFYDGYEGEILVDGIDIRNLDTGHFRSKIGYVQQEPMMFSDTIYNNIAYGVPGAHVEQVINAADVANAHEFIARQPDAYDSMLGERGVGLSGGEKQRISIARAVLMNPSILIFDEATAAVDSETENLIQEAIERLISGRTTLMIAHRLSTLRKANKIIVVDQGRIIECGSHDELMALGGKYHRLIEIQSMSEKLRKSKEEERFD